MERIINLHFNKHKQALFKEDRYIKLDLLVITIESDKNIVSENFAHIEAKAKELNLRYDCLTKAQVITSFDQYYNVFKMRSMIIIKTDQNNKVKCVSLLRSYLNTNFVTRNRLGLKN